MKNLKKIDLPDFETFKINDIEKSFIQGGAIVRVVTAGSIKEVPKAYTGSATNFVKFTSDAYNEDSDTCAKSNFAGDGGSDVSLMATYTQPVTATVNESFT